MAKSYTVFGEACADECNKRGYTYTWCHKKVASSLGQWTDSGQCSVYPNVTSFGEQCIDECETRGQRWAVDLKNFCIKIK